METTHSGHPGILRSLRDPEKAIRADISLRNGDLSLHTQGQLLGQWRLADVSIELLPVGVFHLFIENESWFFTADHPGQLAGAIDVARSRQDDRGPPSQVSAESTAPEKRQIPFTAVALGLAAISFFGLGFLVGSDAGDAVTSPAFYILLLCSLAGVAWVLVSLAARRQAEVTEAAALTLRSRAASASAIKDRLQLGSQPGVAVEKVARTPESASSAALEETLKEPSEPEAAPDEGLLAPGQVAAPDRDEDEPPGQQEDGHIPQAPDTATPDHRTAVLRGILDAATQLSNKHSEVPASGADIPVDDGKTAAHGAIDETVELLVEVERAQRPTVGIGAASEQAGTSGGDGVPVSLTSSGYQKVLELLTEEQRQSRSAWDQDSDDLEQIVGIGPVFADALRSLGYSTFHDVAMLDESAIEKIEGLAGSIRWRLDRYQWRKSAAELHEEKYGTAIDVGAFD